MSNKRGFLFLGKDEERWANVRVDKFNGVPWKDVQSVLVPPTPAWETAMGYASASPGRSPSRLSNDTTPVRGWEVRGPLSPPIYGPTSLQRTPLRMHQLRAQTWHATTPPPKSPSSHEPTMDEKSPESSFAEHQLAVPEYPRPSRDDTTSPMQLEATGDAQGDSISQRPTSGMPSKFDTPDGEAQSQTDSSTLPGEGEVLSFEARRELRRRLLQDARQDRTGAVRPNPADVAVQEGRPRIPLYGNLDILTLRPRRKIEHVEGTLYDEDGPFKEGAVSDSLSVRLFSTKETNTSSSVYYLITTPDNRVFSAAKRRRWAMDNRGKLFAAMEIKSVEAKFEDIASDTPGCAIPAHYADDLRKHYVDDILDELQKAESLRPSASEVTPHVLQTEDGKIVRLEEDFPEEAFFAIAGCDDDELYPVVSRVFVDGVCLLWRLHSHGWVHGDIKLENLMFDSELQLQIIDFENASTFRGTPQHDGKIQLLSFDWTPPELEISPMGRRMGPSGDLWALGCNMIRAFALRDGITDRDVRNMLLGDGLPSFFAFRRSLFNYTDIAPNAPPVEYGINLTPLLDAANIDTTPPYANPARLLRLFATLGPKLLQYFLRYCVAPTPEERDEKIGMQLADEMLHDPAEEDNRLKADRALARLVEQSGSAWVKPKLDEARQILGL